MPSKPIRIELPFELDQNTVNVYLFTEPEPVLVDTGEKSDASWQALTRGLAQHGLCVADLSRVILTHAHIDHCGHAPRIAAESNAQIWVADVGADWIINFPQRWRHRERYYRDIFVPAMGLPEFAVARLMAYLRMIGQTYEAVPKDRVVTFGADTSIGIGGVPWRVLHTPGHASTLTCFYQPDSRQLLASDMLLQRTPTPVVEAPPDGQARVSCLAQFLDSLDRMENLDIDLVYPGHGEPFVKAQALIHRQHERIHHRKQECLAHVAAGTDTIPRLMLAMYPRRPDTMAGLWMLVGYLDLLVGEGNVRIDGINGVWHYHAVA